MISNVIVLGERMTLRRCQTDRFKSERLSLSIVLPIEKTAYLTSLLFSVLLRGTERYPTVAALNRRLDYLYGAELSVSNHYCGDCHTVGFSVEFLSDDYLGTDAGTLLPDLCELMAQILFRPALDENGLLNGHYVESEKRLQCDAIRAKQSNPNAYTAQRLNTLMYGQEPAGIPMLGTEKEVMAVTPELLSAYWRALLRTLRLEFFYVGNADTEALQRAIGDAFACEMRVSDGAVPVSQPCGEAPCKRDTRYVEDTLPVKQGHLAIGLRAAECTLCDDLFYACTFFNELLGGSPVSKLFMNVREKLSLCYSCYSAYMAYKGAIVICCGLDNANRERAETEIMAQIRAIADGDFTDEEWRAAQKSLENAYWQKNDSPRAMEAYYFGRALVGRELSIEDCLARFARLTRDEVMAAAARFTTDVVFFLRADPNALGGGEEDLDEDD